MTQTDPLQQAQQSIQPQGFGTKAGVDTSPNQPAAPQVPDGASGPPIDHPIWAKTLATIAGVISGDRYASVTPPPPGGQFTGDALNQMTAQNQQELEMQQQIQQENAAKWNAAAQGAVDAQKAANAPPGGADWRVDVLNGIGAPVTPSNLEVLSAWQKAEGGGGVAGGPTPSNYNWLNTTEDWPGATPINSVGVKSYGSYEDGIHAIVKNLTGGHYGNILAAFHAGNDPYLVAQAIADSPFGTGQGVMNVLRSMNQGGPSTTVR